MTFAFTVPAWVFYGLGGVLALVILVLAAFGIWVLVAFRTRGSGGWGW